jgi:hypothetical protein
MPAFHVWGSSGDLYHIQDELERLIDGSASSEEVVRALGAPMAYHKDTMSYIACGRPMGVDFYVGPHEIYGGGWEEPPRYDCFELVLELGTQDRISGYRKILITDMTQFGSLEERTRTLRGLAEQGDMLAEKLLKETLVYRAEQENSDAQYQLYFRGSSHIERLKWLCRSADSGYPFAQAEVGRLYRWGLQGVEQNFTKAYSWYWRANKQTPAMWKDELNEALRKAFSVEMLSPSKEVMTEWQLGQCEHDIVPSNSKK